MSRDNDARELTPGESAAFDAWKASEPHPPEPDRPQYKRPDDSLAVGLTLLLAFLGLISGFVALTMGGAIQNDDVMMSGLFCAVGIPVGVLVIGFVLRGVNRAYHDKQHARQLDRLGWTEYDQDLEAWKLAGDQYFGELVKSVRRPVVTGDSELDDLEDRLNRAVPGPRQDIVLAPARRFRREAKRLAQLRSEQEKAGKPFVAQVRVPARRKMLVNNVGWFSSGSITEAEETTVRAEVEPYFTAHDLEIVKFWLQWRGMRNGDGGNFEFLDVVIRVR